MARARTRRRGKGSPWKGTIRIAIVFALLICVNLYFFVFRRGTSLADLMKAAHDHGAPAAVGTPGRGTSPGTAPAPGTAAGEPGRTAAPLATPRPAPPVVDAGPVTFSDEGRLDSGTITSGDTLTSVLARAGVSAATTAELLAALKPRFEPDKLHPGHEYALRFDAEERLRSLELRVAPDRLYRVERGAGKGEPFRVSIDAARLEVKLVAIGGTLDGSLYDGVRRAGEGPQLAATAADVLGAEIDLLVESQPADRFKLVAEKHFLGGRFQRYGRLLAVELGTKASTVRGFWFAPTAGSGSWYTASGESLSRSPLRSPLRYVKLPAGFDRKRLHPVPRTEQARAGVEWGAPSGTPVVATAGGRVQLRGKRPNDGECVVIKHPGGMETTYAHLAAPARGLEAGQEVRQHQVIGYVGASGLSPGAPPRLHYAMRVGGHSIDPLRVKQVRQAPVPDALRDRFQAAIAPLAAQLDRVEALPPPRQPPPPRHP